MVAAAVHVNFIRTAIAAVMGSRSNPYRYVTVAAHFNLKHANIRRCMNDDVRKRELKFQSLTVIQQNESPNY